MKNLRNLCFVILGAIMLFSQCESYKTETFFGNNTIEGNKILKRETRKISGYNTIVVKGGFDVVLIDQPQGEIQIEGEENIIPLINTELKERNLELNFVKFKNIKQNEKLVVYIPAQNIQYLELKGSGDIKNKGDLKSQKFKINLQGSGDIILNNLVTEKLDLSLQGSGDVDLSGSAKNFALNIQGSGDISASKLVADEVDVKLQGSGDVIIYAEKAFSGDVRGSGNIKVKGKPNKIYQSKKGSGNIEFL